MPIEPSPHKCLVVFALVSLLCGASHLPPVYAQQSPAAPVSGAAQTVVTGTVRGQDNKPVVGATVVWYMYFVSDDDVAPTSKTDASGRFALSLPNDLLQKIPKDAESKFLGVATVYAPGLAVASVNLDRGGENAVVLSKPPAYGARFPQTTRPLPVPAFS